MALIKVIELLAESSKGWEDAANVAIREATSGLSISRILMPKLRMERFRNTGSTAK
jgi:Dodecin